MATSRAQVLKFIRSHSIGVQASVSHELRPQAAAVGFAITDAFDRFFDTTESTRKAANLRTNAHASFVIGGVGDGERTVQFEGIADEPIGDELAELKARYFSRFPEGSERASWPGIMAYRRITTTGHHSLS